MWRTTQPWQGSDVLPESLQKRGLSAVTASMDQAISVPLKARRPSRSRWLQTLSPCKYNYSIEKAFTERMFPLPLPGFCRRFHAPRAISPPGPAAESTATLVAGLVAVQGGADTPDPVRCFPAKGVLLARQAGDTMIGRVNRLNSRKLSQA